MKPTLGVLLVAVLLPFCLGAVFQVARDLQTRLVVWLSCGLLLGQWMHAMTFFWADFQAGARGTTTLNVFYIFHVPWWLPLCVSAPVLMGLAFALQWAVRDVDATRLTWLLGLLVAALTFSQAAGSSIPKLSGEVAMALFFVAGILVNRYFLTYAPGQVVPSSQVQSDALTSLGLLVSLVSLWWPAQLQFGQFLFEKYFKPDPAMAQLQMTRFAVYCAWMLLGISLIGWRTIELLVAARRGRM